MRWALVGISMAVYFVGACALTARAMGGWSRLMAAMHTDEPPMRYLLAAVALSVATAVAINPLDDRSFDASDWIRTALIVAGTAWSARAARRRRTA